MTTAAARAWSHEDAIDATEAVHRATRGLSDGRGDGVEASRGDHKFKGSKRARRGPFLLLLLEVFAEFDGMVVRLLRLLVGVRRLADDASLDALFLVGFFRELLRRIKSLLRTFELGRRNVFLSSGSSGGGVGGGGGFVCNSSSAIVMAIKSASSGASVGHASPSLVTSLWSPSFPTGTKIYMGGVSSAVPTRGTRHARGSAPLT